MCRIIKTRCNGIQGQSSTDKCKKKEIFNLLLQHETSVRELYIDRRNFSERIVLIFFRGGGDWEFKTKRHNERCRKRMIPSV